MQTIDDLGVAVHTIFGVGAVLLRNVLVPEFCVVGDPVALAAVDHTFAAVQSESHFLELKGESR
jgi:hypothetical protein